MKQIKEANKQFLGFTVPELLVSTAIFLVILLITMVNLKQGNQTNELRLKALEVANDIRRVQNNALSAQAMPNGNIPDRWGIHFSNQDNKYIIFAESDCTLCSIDYEKYFFDNSDYLVQTINLPSKFQIDAMNSPKYRIDNNPVNTCLTTKDNVMDIVFTVPKGNIHINGILPLGPSEIGNCGNYNPSWVNLKYLPTGRNISIRINWISGQITTTDINN